jgi:hypothetical protein
MLSIADARELIDEMKKPSLCRIRDLVVLPAFQGLSQNENGCARIDVVGCLKQFFGA